LLSPDHFDQQYNNRARVPDFANYLAQWADSSAQARSLLGGLTDISYGAGPSETLDIFSSAQHNAPVVVFIHGGYWRSLDKSDHSFIAPAWVEQGACVVVPNYALCPAVSIPHIVMQMLKALAWVWRYISHWGGDPSRIHLVGHSAGGHLAAMMMACRWPQYQPDLPPDLVKSVLSVSGLYELDSVMRSSMLQASLHLSDEQVLRCSPAWMPAPSTGSLVSVVGALESDAFISHNHLIQQAWGTQRVPWAENLAGLNHFSIVNELAKSGSHLHGLLMRQLVA
jgi:arylformamidase